jgi:LacI family transcriptional regulator
LLLFLLSLCSQSELKKTQSAIVLLQDKEYFPLVGVYFFRKLIAIQVMNVPKVALLIENSRGYGRDLLKGISNYSRIHGPWTFYRMPTFYLDPNATIRKKEIHRLKNWGATGIIMREVQNNEELIEMGVPVVLSTYKKERIPDTYEIYVDNKGIGAMAAEYLLELGFKNFAFCGFDGFFWSLERQEGFTEKIKHAGYKVLVYKQPKSKIKRLWDNEQVILAQWLESLPKPIGLMACIDERSQDVTEACKIAKIHLPEEIALIGGDNDDLICDLSNPPLSSVAINGVKAGYEAAELLDKLMKGEKVPDDEKIVVRPTHVETRQSTDILAIEDSDVAAAIRYIRQHANEPIQVDDVVDSTTLGRRGLEKHFKQTLGRSVNAEIRRIRVDRIVKLLLETNLSISQIASTLGYSSENNISRFFRKEKKMSLLNYRKLYVCK